jgi:hypothetical protein
MAGVQGKGERRIIMIGDNRYGMPEEYDPVRKQKTIMQYREGDTSTRESKAVFNGTGLDLSTYPQRQLNYGKKVVKETVGDAVNPNSSIDYKPNR